MNMKPVSEVKHGIGLQEGEVGEPRTEAEIADSPSASMSHS